MYTFGLDIDSARSETLAAPLLYAVAVSLYTVVNFALWAGVVGLVLLVFMAFTIILIPVSMLLLLLLFLSIAFGLVSFGVSLGKRLASWMKADLRPEYSAALGSFILMVAINLLSQVPFIEGIIPLVIMVMGLGAVLLTRFGARTFVPAVESESL